MPELPEVESVRRGLADLVPGRRITSVTVLHPRLLRDQPGGPAEFVDRVRGQVLGTPARRGKFMWLPLEDSTENAEQALVVHLGMSGQVRVVPTGAAVHPHTRVTAALDDGSEVRFVDQRMFGRLLADDLVPTAAPGEAVPSSVAHIARDPLDPRFDARSFVARLRARRTTLKRALLDQTLVSGVGNIYADESLWRSRLHGERPTHAVAVATARRLLGNVVAVLGEAVAAGGTSFDVLYVNVNGESGWFESDLAVYGRAGAGCRRCGSVIRRDVFTNRSSFTCPACQRKPRTGPTSRAGAASP